MATHYGRRVERCGVIVILLALGFGVLMVDRTPAQPPVAQVPGPPPTCDDQLRAGRIQLQATTLSQLRERSEAAQALAIQEKEIERLRGELTALKKPASVPALPEGQK